MISFGCYPELRLLDVAMLGLVSQGSEVEGNVAEKELAKDCSLHADYCSPFFLCWRGAGRPNDPPGAAAGTPGTAAAADIYTPFNH